MKRECKTCIGYGDCNNKEGKAYGICPSWVSFPTRHFDPPADIKDVFGLTKREYFAGLAMQSAINRMDMSGNDFGVYTKNVAINSVAFADALIAELSKEEE